MIVSMVMPETGLRAVVAMALAATEVKKKEKTRVSTRPTRTTTARRRRGCPGRSATASDETIDADEDLA